VTLEHKDQVNMPPPCMIVQSTKPPSYVRLAKELSRMEDVVAGAEKREAEMRSRGPGKAK
jgi:hypothetical protein